MRARYGASRWSAVRRCCQRRECERAEHCHHGSEHHYRIVGELELVPKWEADTETHADRNGNVLMEANDRAPLFTDEQIRQMPQPFPSTEHERVAARWGMREMRDQYEALITSGELMVNRKEEYGETMFIYFATMKPYSPTRSQCSRCNHSWLTAEAPRIGGFCMCGSKIVEA